MTRTSFRLRLPAAISEAAMERVRIGQAVKKDSASIARLFLISSDGLAEYIWSRVAEPGGRRDTPQRRDRSGPDGGGEPAGQGSRPAPHQPHLFRGDAVVLTRDSRP
ncbi:MAG: hypothetical protein O7A06_00350 [Acidobacteria bacterium]|nr:hypothetical protein [Acidobacteriota bacterium]